MNYGLIISPPTPEDFIFGAQKLGDAQIQPDGQWDGWLPDFEPQSRPGSFDSYGCVTFSTLSIVEILERHEYGATRNWSDRFLAKASSTDKARGNQPSVVAEILRKKGCVEEKEMPFDSSITSFESFYSDIPQNLWTLAIQFIAEYAFGYEHVPSNAKDIMRALTYSPVLFTVSAWYKDESGLYYRPQGETDGHAVVCYGYEEGKYFKILDSYADNEGLFLKKVRWNSLPMQCKRFTLSRQILVESAWSKFVKLLRALLGYA
ncbi:MAG: hypothetical protein AAB922_07725 [Patescibacteria group bacterium]